MPNIKNMDFSTDGISWTSASVNISINPVNSIFEQGLIENDITSIENANYIWGAVGKNGLILKSSQITNSLGTFDPVYYKEAEFWTTLNSNFGNTLIVSIAYGNGLWVAGGQSGQLRTSTDAITWTSRTSNFGSSTINSVAYGNGLWAIGGALGQIGTSSNSTKLKSQLINSILCFNSGSIRRI
jgi:hypothetical protein